MNDWVMLGIGLTLTVGTGIFVASEFALVNLDRHDLETRSSNGERRLRPTIAALRITSTHLSSAQLGITLTTLLTGYTFEPAASSLLEGPLTGAGVPEGAVPGFGAVAGLLLATFFSMVIGELVPKNFAIALPLATAKVVIPFQTAFTLVFRPAVMLLNNNANTLIRAAGIEPKEELSGARTADELTYLIRHSATAGLLEKDDATLLNRALRFTAYDASDVMTPRVKMVSVAMTDTADDVLGACSTTGYSRFPVTQDGPDQIVGFVHAKRAFAVDLDDRASVKAADLMVEPTRVPDTMSADVLLTQLRDEGLQIAVVTDEYGGTAGIVTLEDLIEEIVGELEDEHDRPQIGMTHRGTSVSFDAAWRPDEVRERAGVVIPEDDDWDTASGYVTDRLDRMPELGDEVSLDSGILRVERMDGSRIARLQFIPLDSSSGADEADEESADEIPIPPGEEAAT